MAKKRKIFKRAPKSDEYVVWRNRKGKITKPRGGIYLIGEIRDRQTKKIKGYLNSKNKESGKPNPQRFTAIQRSILTTPKRIATANDKLKGSVSWIMRSSKPMIEQVPQKVVTAINKEINLNGDCMVALDIESRTIRRFRMRSDARFFNRRVTKQEISAMMTIDILQILNSEMIRMSPKQKSNDKQERRKHIKTLHCKMLFVSF